MNGGDRKTILLVEDEVITAMLEKQQLEKYGYSVHHVTTGEKAVQTILDNVLPVDLILMDVDLGSGIDGTQASEQILYQKDIPIVFLSSHTEPEVVEKTEKITSYGYVVKNSGIVVLNASIKMAFRLFEAKTKEKKQEEALRESHHRFEAILESLDEGILLVVASTRKIIDCNDAAIKLFGYSREELVSCKTDILHVDQEHFDQFGQEAFVAYNNLGYYKTEFKMKRKDGTVFPSENFVRPLRDQDGKISYVVSLVRDITDRKQAEESLELDRKRFSMLLESFPGFIYLQSSDYSVRYTNKYFIEHFGKINGKRCFEVMWGRDAPCEVCPTFKVFDTNTPQIWEWLSAPDGKNYIIHDFPFIDSDGSKLVLEIGIDITELKQAEEEIQKQLTEKETLLREVHHRVKNNITNIESFLALQADSTDNLEAKAAIKDAISRVQSTRVLYDKLLLSKDLREISMKNYVEDLIDSLLKVFVDKDNIIIEKHISEFRILSNQAITIGIIINELLTNVFKHSFKDRDKGIVSISIQKTENNVTLIIQDNGIGADERIMENKPPGFGLTIVKMLVEQLQGTYSIVNKNGTRSVIEFELS